MNRMAIAHQRWMRSPIIKAWRDRTRTIQVLADLVCAWAAADETTIHLDVVAFRNVQPLDARTTVLADKRIMEVPTTSPSPSTRLISHAKASAVLLALSYAEPNLQGARGRNARSVRSRRRPSPGDRENTR